MELWALVKVVSLGYLCGLVSLTLATLLWHFLRRYLAPAQRAAAGFSILAGSFAINTVLALVIFLGVVNQQIKMSTPYFHQLMHGGWGLLITAAGGVLLAVSLILTWWSWQRGRIPAQGGTAVEYLQFADKQLRIHPGVPTISLVGVWRPELWVNPAYWSMLDDAQRVIALRHETTHLARRDNLTRLIVQHITSLYAVLPWVRRWPAGYELDCELAVDDACRRRFAPAEYLALIAQATAFALNWREPVIASHLSYSDQTVRLKILAGQPPAAPRYLGVFVGGLAACLSAAPVATLLLNPVSRCLCACYLGY